MQKDPSSDTRFRRLFGEHETAIREYCSRRLDVHEANDAAAEVFLVAWRKIDRLPSDSDQLPWLYGVARNVVRNLERSRRRRGRLVAKLNRTAPSPYPSPEHQVVRRAEERLVLEALSRLRPDDRELIQLRAWEELTRSELAAVLDITVEAVDMRLSRALKRLARGLRASGFNLAPHAIDSAVKDGGDR